MPARSRARQERSVLLPYLPVEIIQMVVGNSVWGLTSAFESDWEPHDLESLSSWRLVCRAWNRAIAPLIFRHIYIYYSLDFRKLSKLLGDSRSKYLGEFIQSISTDSLEEAEYYAKDIQRLVKQCPNLSSLEFWASSDAIHIGRKGHLRHLAKLSFLTFSLDDFPELLRNNISMRSLRVYNWFHRSASFPQPRVTFPPSLKSLDIACPVKSKMAIRRDFALHELFPNLFAHPDLSLTETLRLTACQVSLDTLTNGHLQSLANVQHLALEGCACDKVLELPGHFICLTTLSLGSQNTYGEDMQASTFLVWLLYITNGLLHLKELTISSLVLKDVHPNHLKFFKTLFTLLVKHLHLEKFHRNSSVSEPLVLLDRLYSYKPIDWLTSNYRPG